MGLTEEDTKNPIVVQEVVLKSNSLAVEEERPVDDSVDEEEIDSKFTILTTEEQDDTNGSSVEQGVEPVEETDTNDSIDEEETIGLSEKAMKAEREVELRFLEGQWVEVGTD